MMENFWSNRFKLKLKITYHWMNSHTKQIETHYGVGAKSIKTATLHKSYSFYRWKIFVIILDRYYIICFSKAVQIDEVGPAPDLTILVPVWMNWSADNISNLNPALMVLAQIEVNIAGKYLKSEFVFLGVGKRKRWKII